jgi:hypothetical protein
MWLVQPFIDAAEPSAAPSYGPDMTELAHQP